MFTAMVLFCSIHITGNCVEATDDRGPYLTEKACQARIEEMISDTRTIFPYMAPIGVKCDQDMGEQT